jgi:hypothetical protein
MKNRRGVIVYLVLIMFIVALVACASTAKKESTGEYVKEKGFVCG